MCENRSPLGRDPTPFRQPRLIRPPPLARRQITELSASFPSPGHPDPVSSPPCWLARSWTGLLGHHVLSLATGSPLCNVRSPGIAAAAHPGPRIVHGLELSSEQFVQFSEVQSIRRNADIKSSRIQEAFLLLLLSSMPSRFSFFVRGDLGSGGGGSLLN